LATPVFVHGKSGTFSWGTNLFNALSINFEESTTLEDITYSQAGGAATQVVLPGYRKAGGSVTFIYDTANQPTVSPYDMRPWPTNAPAVPVLCTFSPDGTKSWQCYVFSERLGFTTGPQAGAVKCTMAFQATFYNGVGITEPAS
jgi:hypothetical protein